MCVTRALHPWIRFWPSAILPLQRDRRKQLQESRRYFYGSMVLNGCAISRARFAKHKQ